MAWLSFDCYGTLIDWERGILDVLRPTGLSDPDILARYGRFEAEIEAGPYRSYRDVLREVGERFGGGGLDATAWEPFPDSTEALRRLGRRYKLAILSNVDDDIFEVSARKLGVRFDAIVTARQCRSYKPSLNNFRVLLDRLGEAPTHCAQSLFHDHVPAKSLGWKTAWVKRGGTIGTGVDVAPDLVVPDLAALADALGA